MRWARARDGTIMYSAIPPWNFLNPNMSCGAHIQYQPRSQYMHSPQGTICSTTMRSPTDTPWWASASAERSEEHTSELQSRFDLVCRLLLEKKKNISSSRSHNCVTLT